MFGWARGSKEAAFYTRTANRARLAASGAAKVLSERDKNLLFPHLQSAAGED
jgi:hypothetical protein